MQFDLEGHLIVSPKDVCRGLASPQRLINDILIPGTPASFPTYNRYREFLNACADSFGVHPQNFQLRGSTKLGFSIAPKEDSAWHVMRADSDIDLAIIDPDYYHYLDAEIRKWERNPANRAFVGPAFNKSIARQRQRQFYTYRYFDLPSIGCVQEHNQRIKGLPVEKCCGEPRPIDAFVFRDWWSLSARWESDLRDLKKSLASGLPQGGDQPIAEIEDSAASREI